MKKEVKDTIIAELGEKLKNYPHFYLVDVTGLNAEATSSLRRKCFKSEINMVVVKEHPPSCTLSAALPAHWRSA